MKKEIKTMEQETKVRCNFCQYEWNTKSKRMYVSCPNCLRKNFVEVNKNEILKNQ